MCDFSSVESTFYNQNSVSKPMNTLVRCRSLCHLFGSSLFAFVL